MLAGCFRTPSQASQLPQLDRVCPWNAVECGSWLACEEALTVTAKPKEKAPTQPTADRGRSGLDEGFLYDRVTAR